MSDIQLSGGATTLLDRPGPATSDLEDEFALDLRVVVMTGGFLIYDCDTSDGCGNTCSGDDSSCNSFTDNPSD